MNEKTYRLLEAKREIELGGGEAMIESQHKAGKLTARERLKALFDKASFIEIGGHRTTVESMHSEEIQEDGVITGYGTVHGRLVFAYAQDFTVKSGSLGKIHGEKISNIQDIALKMGGPIIGINDSAGARIEEGLDILSEYGKIFHRNTLASGVIPQISIIMGPLIGTGVYSPALTDFIFMVKENSVMFNLGPKIIRSTREEEVTKEELGGAHTHNKISGVAHFMDNTEEDCINRVKELLSYLPSNNLDSLPVYETGDDINRVDEKLNEIIPSDPNELYNIKDIIKTIADNGDWFEVQEFFAENILTGYIRLQGKTIGVVANQPSRQSGLLDINASDKAGKFIRTCNAFNIPLLNLVDVEGFLPGLSQEYGGIIKHGAKMIYAYSEASVPKVTLIIRKAYGGAYIAMGSKELGADQVFAWPSAEIGIMPAEGAANIIFKENIKNSKDPISTRKEKIQKYRENIVNPYFAAKKGCIDDIIIPSRTRPRLISTFNMLESKRQGRPSKKHGNIPF